MTWEEFRDYVDDKMEEKGTQNVEIDYIDVSSITLTYSDNKPEVVIDELGLSIF